MAHHFQSAACCDVLGSVEDIYGEDLFECLAGPEIRDAAPWVWDAGFATQVALFAHAVARAWRKFCGIHDIVCGRVREVRLRGAVAAIARDRLRGERGLPVTI